MLILTIIVMIILAAAIILSLNSSGIIGTANKAKNDSDIASMKEYLNTLQTEWEAMSEDQRAATGYSSMEDYISAKFEEKGYTIEEVEDGWLSVEEAKMALEIGDVVNYKVIAKNVKANVYLSHDISNQDKLTWRYIGISDDGKIMIAPDVTADDPQLCLAGPSDYLNGPDELNRLCWELYTTDKGTARSMTIEDVNNLLGYTGEKRGYMVSARYYPAPDGVVTIADFKEKVGKIFYDETPDGVDNIDTYEVDYYEIKREDDVGKMIYPEHGQYVYCNGSYWLASKCTKVEAALGRVYFNLRMVNSDCVSDTQDRYLWDSKDKYGVPTDAALRPVVLLDSDVLLKEVSNGVWKLS